MGKVRNARRNPPVTISDLQDAKWLGGTVEHRGESLEVVRRGGLNNPWILRSGQGVQYAAKAYRDGSVSVELLGLA